jgi:hypothetical protein
MYLYRSARDNWRNCLDFGKYFSLPPPKKTQNLSENSDQGRTIYYVTYFVYGKSLMILFLFQPPEHRWIRFPQKTPKDLVLASFYQFYYSIKWFWYCCRGDLSKTGRFLFSPYISQTNYWISLKFCFYVFHIVMNPPYFLYNLIMNHFPIKYL